MLCSERPISYDTRTKRCPSALGSTLLTLCAFAALPPITVTAQETAKRQTAAKAPLVSLDFEDANVRTVIAQIARKGKLTVKFADSVSGTVTVHLQNHKALDALEIVAEMAELSARRVGDTYIVAPRDEMRAILLKEGQTRKIALLRVTPASAEVLLERAFPDLSVTAGDRAVDITGASDDLDRAELMIRRADQGLHPEDAGTQERVKVANMKPEEAAHALVRMLPGLDVRVEGQELLISGAADDIAAAKRRLAVIDTKDGSDTQFRIYYVNYVATTQLIDMVSKAVKNVEIFNGPDSFLPSKPGFNPISNSISKGSLRADAVEAKDYAGKKSASLLIKGPADAVEQAIKILTLMDVSPTQMLIDVRIVETSPQFASHLGIDWTWNNITFSERGKTNAGATGYDTGPVGIGTFKRSPFNPVANLNALITNQKVKILANPQIAVLNDQDASIFIGDQIRFETTAETSPQTGTTFTTVETPIGIILLVHPRANDDGYITLHVQPVISVLTGFTGTLPQNSVREAETTLRVHDGDTFVLGGLIRETTQVNQSRIPLLGDLPLLGRLFRSDSKSKLRTEVMVFVTVHIIR